MPYKFNESRRRKIPEAKHRVANWPEHDAALVRRGSLTVWMTKEAVRPSSADDFTPGFCRINGPRQKSDATCSTE
jgi:hypothetical protein